MLPSPYPYFDLKRAMLSDGMLIPASSFCKKAIVEKAECTQHYKSLETRTEGYYQCPFGFTTRNFSYAAQMWMVTGLVAHPRFGSANERQKAKEFPANRTSREAIAATIAYLREIEQHRADAIQEASKVLPQAFHELRKLNGAVLQHAEREINDRGETRNIVSIKSAAELMRNNFDILEALSNIEGMRALPSDSTINVFDLSVKMKRVLQERAEERGIHITVNGVRAIIRGSQKSFPIVPAVLLENAIKYGTANRPVRVAVTTKANQAVLTVENDSTGFIDPVRCFDRGARFSSDVEGGGFGLFLAREIVACHKGTIRCEVGAGSVRMIVDLPLVTVVPQ